MGVTATLVRLGSVASMLVALAAVGLLFVGGVGAEGISVVGLLATLAFLVVAVGAAVAWGRREALARWETPYW
ncbi:hypothetical protein [Halobaculum marinum]|uniref:Uncharacterized protein n=1 Tax=Halobaculum marinum TaxID=3031996 RepID=A0ABD5WQW9_9EURY|nr:hypothetical protein [Halobaculum sp. DT55]